MHEFAHAIERGLHTLNTYPGGRVGFAVASALPARAPGRPKGVAAVEIVSKSYALRVRRKPGISLTAVRRPARLPYISSASILMTRAICGSAAGNWLAKIVSNCPRIFSVPDWLTLPATATAASVMITVVVFS